MAHNDNIKTFDTISKHLEIEDERQKSVAPPSVALVAKKGQHAPQSCRPGKGVAKKQKAKGNGDKSIACVKCCNCGRKRH